MHRSKNEEIERAKNLTQLHLAEQLGVSQSGYSKLDFGDSEISYNKLEKISSALGMKSEDFIELNESMVFNVMHNNNGNNGFVVNNNQLTDNERILY